MPAATVTIASGATWQEVAADRQAYRDASIATLDPVLPDIPSIPLNTIPLAKQILTDAEVKITETTVEKLIPKLANGELSAVEVAKAFLRRAGLAQKAVRLSAFLADPASRRCADKLCNGTAPRTSSPASRIPRCLPSRTWQASRGAAWRPDKRERTSRNGVL
jgi:hypothetical protein